MASGASYSPLREDTSDRLEFEDASPYPQDDAPYPNAGNPRVRSVGFKGRRSFLCRECSKRSVLIGVIVVVIAIVFISLVASLVARRKCVPSIASTGPPPSTGGQLGVVSTTAGSRPSTTSSTEVEITTVTTPGVATSPSSPPIATNGEVFPWTNIRLPKTVQPLHYDLEMITNLDNFKVSGSVLITFTVSEPTDCIIMHVKNISLQQPSEVAHVSTDRQGLVHQVTKMLFYENHNQVCFHLKSQLHVGSTYTISLQFSYSLTDALDGYYRSSYIENGEKRYLAATQFEPTSARQAFPCFDEPQLKATFSMKMTRGKALISLFNTERIDTISVDNATERDVFNTSVRMSTYLVAFVVCDFVHIASKTSSGTDIAVYASPDKISQAGLALGVLNKTIPFYEEFFGVEYPLSKQDMIGIPDFSAGAMENWGLITFREPSLLYQEGVTSPRSKQWIVLTITHELAHQWFGNLVTMEWWNDLWLNEGFASYVEYIGTDHIYPEWGMMDQFTVFTTQRALEVDARANSHPISVTVRDPNEISAIFDSISYDKGSSIIRMLHDFLPEQAFSNGLKHYLQAFKFKNAETKDLWESMTLGNEQSIMHQQNISKMMDTWTLQMGYPVVCLSRQGAKVTATQKHFLSTPNAVPSSDFPSPFGYKWTIPLTYITNLNVTHGNPVIMDKTKDEVQFTLQDTDTKWYKANVNQSGFYRVNYDSANWDALIKQLVTNHELMSSADRANLIDDAFNLAWAGQLSQIKALSLSLYLLKERDFSPLSSGLSNLNKIGSVLKNTEGYESYVDYVLRLLAPQLDVFKREGWDSKIPYLQSFLRSSVLYQAVVLGHRETINQALDLFNNWTSSGFPVPADLKNTVYCAGVMYGTREDWDFCWNEYMNTTVASEKRVLISAMACAHDPFLINRYLHWSLSKIPSQDSGTVIARIASQPAGSHPALAFVIDNWSTLVQRYEGVPFELPFIIKSVTDNVASKFEYSQAAEFFQSNFIESMGSKRAVQQALEKMEANVAWLAAHRDETTQWFGANAKG